MNEHRVPSIRETLSWYKDKLKNGKASEEMFKTEALSFFNLSPEMGAKDKRSFKREIEHFADMHQSLLRKWLREFLAENGGLGKNHDNPPSDFGLEIENENDRKRAFLKFGRDGVKSWWKYQDWLEEECALFRESVKNSKGKKPVEDKEDHDEESNNQIRLLRERSSGKNIWGILLEGDLPIVFSCSATPGGLPLKMRPSFQPRLWATTDEYHFTHEYL